MFCPDLDDYQNSMNNELKCFVEIPSCSVFRKKDKFIFIFFLLESQEQFIQIYAKVRKHFHIQWHNIMQWYD